MKTKSSFLVQIISALVLITLFISCDSGTEIPFGTELGNGVTKDFTSVSGGFFSSPSGAKIEVNPGNILKNDKGEVGTVTFSIEDNVPLNELPAPIPSKFQLVGNVISFGPLGFTFAMPVIVWLPAKNEPSPDGLYVIHYDDAKGWVQLPLCDINGTDKTLGVSTFTLGYFAVVRHTGEVSVVKSKPVIQGAKSEGAIKFGDFNAPGDNKMRYGRWFIITIKSYTLKYPEQEDVYNGSSGDGGLICLDSRTCSDPTSTFPRHPTIFRLPQGTYEFWVTAYSYSCGAQYHSGFFIYNQTITVTVDKPLVYYGWGSIDDNSYTHFNTTLTSSDWTYTSAQPTFKGDSKGCWPVGTTPYGTGYFKATLKWYNSSSSSTDLDLYLTCPDGKVIWYGSKKGDYVELDRDWMSGWGNATENIYSVSNMPKGQYIVKVNLFGGPAKSFQVDIKRGTYFKSYRRSVSTSGETVIIETFNLK